MILSGPRLASSVWDSERPDRLAPYMVDTNHWPSICRIYLLVQTSYQNQCWCCMNKLLLPWCHFSCKAHFNTSHLSPLNISSTTCRICTATMFLHISFSCRMWIVLLAASSSSLLAPPLGRNDWTKEGRVLCCEERKGKWQANPGESNG